MFSFQAAWGLAGKISMLLVWWFSLFAVVIMELSELASLFERHNEEYLQFDRIDTPRSARPDLHAFLLIDELVPGSEDIIGAAHHDEFVLTVDPQSLSAVINEQQVVELIRCGMRFDASEDVLCMFT